MAGFHGRNGALWVAPTNGASPLPVSNSVDFNYDQKADRVDTTAMREGNKTSVQGLPDFSATSTGFRTVGVKSLMAAALDGQTRRVYWYEDFTNSPTAWIAGDMFIDYSTTSAVNDAAKFSATFAAAGTISFGPGWTA